MNQYGEMARRHWARWLPERFAAIENPEAFFTGLGDEAEQRITALAWDLAGDDPPGGSVMMPKALRSVMSRLAAMSRRRTPGSCATSSRTRAWAVRKVQLATLIGYQIPENYC